MCIGPVQINETAFMVEPIILGMVGLCIILWMHIQDRRAKNASENSSEGEDG